MHCTDAARGPDTSDVASVFDGHHRALARLQEHNAHSGRGARLHTALTVPQIAISDGLHKLVNEGLVDFGCVTILRPGLGFAVVALEGQGSEHFPPPLTTASTTHTATEAGLPSCSSSRSRTTTTTQFSLYGPHRAFRLQGCGWSVERVALTGEPQHYERSKAWCRSAGSQCFESRTLFGAGMRTVLTLPMTCNRRVCGCVTLATRAATWDPTVSSQLPTLISSLTAHMVQLCLTEGTQLLSPDKLVRFRSDQSIASDMLHELVTLDRVVTARVLKAQQRQRPPQSSTRLACQAPSAPSPMVPTEDPDPPQQPIHDVNPFLAERTRMAGPGAAPVWSSCQNFNTPSLPDSGPTLLADSSTHLWPKAISVPCTPLHVSTSSTLHTSDKSTPQPEDRGRRPKQPAQSVAAPPQHLPHVDPHSDDTAAYLQSLCDLQQQEQQHEYMVGTQGLGSVSQGGDFPDPSPVATSQLLSRLQGSVAYVAALEELDPDTACGGPAYLLQSRTTTDSACTGTHSTVQSGTLPTLAPDGSRRNSSAWDMQGLKRANHTTSQYLAALLMERQSLDALRKSLGSGMPHRRRASSTFAPVCELGEQSGVEAAVNMEGVQLAATSCLYSPVQYL